jgi:hypothetical protein
MKENIIIGRLIPAGQHYRDLQDKINNNNEYFYTTDENIDNSEQHLEEVTEKIEHESDF